MRATESSHSAGKSHYSKPKALTIYASEKQQLIEAARDIFPDINWASIYKAFFYFSTVYLEAVCILGLSFVASYLQAASLVSGSP